jgi:hypothetical protein
MAEATGASIETADVAPATPMNEAHSRNPPAGEAGVFADRKHVAACFDPDVTFIKSMARDLSGARAAGDRAPETPGAASDATGGATFAAIKVMSVVGGSAREDADTFGAPIVASGWSTLAGVSIAFGAGGTIATSE